MSLQPEVRRAIVGFTDKNIRAVNRVFRAAYAHFGRSVWTSQDMVNVILPEPLFVQRYGRASTPGEQELRNSVRYLTEWHFLPDNATQLGKLLMLVVGRFDTELVLLRMRKRGHSLWYLREPWER